MSRIFGQFEDEIGKLQSIAIGAGFFNATAAIASAPEGNVCCVDGVYVSSLSITELGDGAGVPDRLIGTHYWNPPLLMPLVEVITTEYKKAFGFDPRPDLSLKLGEVYLQNNKIEEAKNWWARHLRDAAATQVSWSTTDTSATYHLAGSELVGPDGTAVGSVSGGCVEGAVYDLAQTVVADGTPVLQRYGISDEVAAAVGCPPSDVVVLPVVVMRRSSQWKISISTSPVTLQL